MTRAAIKHSEEQLRRAMLASDVDTLDQLLDEALLFSSPTGDIIRKDDDLELHRSGRQRLTKLEPRELVVELFGDDIGIVTVLSEVAGTFDGQPFDGTFRYLRTWRREHHASWRVIAGAVTKIAAAPSTL
jgi:ketosteroid isomerase-like protein